MVNVFVKNAAEIILFDDTVDGLKRYLRADNTDSDHMIFDSPFPIVGSGTQELTSCAKEPVLLNSLYNNVL